MAGHLMTLIRAHADDWPTLREILLNYPYAEGSTPPGPLWDDWAPTPDTFDDVNTAKNLGLITFDQMTEVLEALIARNAARGIPPGPPPPAPVPERPPLH